MYGGVQGSVVQEALREGKTSSQLGAIHERVVAQSHPNHPPIGPAAERERLLTPVSKDEVALAERAANRDTRQ